ncbi:MsnO8 family LLM class oxidoreductase [Acinetobacter larvae]|uniref:Luciferase-like domain-containing protein n=1 Tax=Acinetobacter larvae TaxID=1789224 RepID=A0A1B2LWA0_9GAMM|nr:MsnO8 family LLM class oxidoreductase [Acinetobacter larvae]AOA57043.1 hypothetical protein BFG52_00840 [Acinetobacter larvae]
MTLKLSFLDKCPIEKGLTAEQALHNAAEIAQKVESLGFYRYWVAEHHHSSQYASPSPELMIAWLIQQTEQIRLGSGGVMLQHYSPYKVAENFNVLSALAAGRIDLGIGKAPGGLPQSTQALQQGLDQVKKGDFKQQLLQVQQYIQAPAVQEPTVQKQVVQEQVVQKQVVQEPTIQKPAIQAQQLAAESALAATPLAQQPAELFLLGASVESAVLAAELGWNFVFAAHLNANQQQLHDALQAFRQRRAQHRHPQHNKAIIAVQMIVAENQQLAEHWAEKLAVWSLHLANGQRVKLLSEQMGYAFAQQAQSEIISLQPEALNIVKGSALAVQQQLVALAEQYAVDELMVEIPLTQHAQRLQMLEDLVAVTRLAA